MGTGDINVNVQYCWGYSLQWTSIPFRGGGGVAILLGMLYAKETRISLSDKISTEFHGILRVFVNFAGFRGFT